MTRSLQLLVEMVSSIRPTESRFRCLFTAQSLRLAGMIRAHAAQARSIRIAAANLSRMVNTYHRRLR